MHLQMEDTSKYFTGETYTRPLCVAYLMSTYQHSVFLEHLCLGSSLQGGKHYWCCSFKKRLSSSRYREQKAEPWCRILSPAFAFLTLGSLGVHAAGDNFCLFGMDRGTDEVWKVSS